MKNSELIEILKNLDPNAQVVIVTEEKYGEVVRTKSIKTIGEKIMPNKQKLGAVDSHITIFHG